MSEKDVLAKFDLDQFLWKPFGADVGSSFQGRQRVLAGGEYSQDTINRYRRGDQTLFFALYIDIASPIQEVELVKAARDAWIWLRYHIPTIATRIEIDNDDTPLLVYQSEPIPGVEKWAERTFIVDKQKEVNLDLLRYQLGEQKVPSAAGDQIWLHLVPGTADGKGTVSKFGLLFHTHHAPFDGSALKIIFNRYLTQLAKILGASESSKEHLEWGKEVDNLIPAAVNVLLPEEPVPIHPTSSEEPSFSHPYYASLGMVLQGIGESLHNPYGYKPRKASDEWPVTRRSSMEFSRAESDAVIKALKPPGGRDKYTLTYVAHAALAMTVLSDNAPGPEASSQYIYSQSLTNCRSSLKEPYSSKEGYPGYTLGVSVMKIPVSTYQSPDGKLLALDKSTLAKSVKVIRELYTKQKEIPASLSYMAQGAFIFSAGIKQAVAANHFPSNHGYSFSSDGPGEEYLNNTFNDDVGGKVLTVEKSVTSLNRTDPGPFFRISSWNGILELSADYNSNSTSAEEVKKHILAWKKFMLLVCDFDDEDF